MVIHPDLGAVEGTRIAPEDGLRAQTWRTVLGLALALGVVGIDLAVIQERREDDGAAADAAAIARRAPIAGVAPSVPTTTIAPTSTTSAPPSTAAAPAPSTTSTTRGTTGGKAASTSRGGAWTLGPYKGMGVWLDVYDWTDELTGGRPLAHLADIDRMADLGIQTLYIQTAHRRSNADVIDRARLMPFIDRAHARGMAVVAWYLPTLEDVAVDLRRLVAAAKLPVDGLGVDIESLAVADPAERTRRLLELSLRLRRAVGNKAIAAITPSAVHLQVVNPSFWPGFPWAKLAKTYDAILPMSYWSVRRPEWKSGERYIGENIDRIRKSTGQPDVPIHVIGGIADGATVQDVRGMVRAIQTRAILGGSLYDWNTSRAAQWNALRPLRAELRLAVPAGSLGS